MAKKGKRERNLHKQIMSSRFADKRAKLVKFIKSARNEAVKDTINPLEIMQAAWKLDKMPKVTVKNRVNARCAGGPDHDCGRARGLIKIGVDKLGHGIYVCRIHFREMGLQGLLHVKKASW